MLFNDDSNHCHVAGSVISWLEDIALPEKLALELSTQNIILNCALFLSLSVGLPCAK